MKTMYKKQSIHAVFFYLIIRNRLFIILFHFLFLFSSLEIASSIQINDLQGSLDVVCMESNLRQQSGIGCASLFATFFLSVYNRNSERNI
jgi:hypothetical protein